MEITKTPRTRISSLCLFLLIFAVALSASQVWAQPKKPIPAETNPFETAPPCLLNPELEHLSQMEVTYIPGDVAIFKNHVYVTSIGDGETGALDVIDVTEPTAPFVTGTCLDPLLKFPVAVTLDPVSNRAYLADCYAVPGHPSYVHVMDIADHGHPFRITGGGSSGNAVDVFYLNGFVYEAAFSGGCAVHEPEFGALMGYCYTFDMATGLYVRGNLAYVAEFMAGGGQLTIVDVSDPFYPQTLGMCRTLGSGAKGVHIVNQAATPWGNQKLYAYIADKDGLQVMDVTDPNDPFRVVHLDLPGDRCLSVFARADYAFVTAGEEGLFVIDLHDPEAPFIAAHSDAMGSAERVTVSGNYVYVTDSSSLPTDDGSGKLHILKLVSR
ncbi:MAG: hypothetical protein ABIK28_22535 [Planctomycetota bacterium]